MSLCHNIPRVPEMFLVLVVMEAAVLMQQQLVTLMHLRHSETRYAAIVMFIP